MRRSIAIALFLIAWPCLTVSAANPIPLAQAVFGSFSSNEGAINATNQISSKTKLPLEIQTADVNGRTWYRVLSTPSDDVSAVEAEVQRLKVDSLPGTWILRTTGVLPSEPLPSEPSSSPASPGQLSRASTDTGVAFAAAPQPAAPPSTSVQSPDSEPVMMAAIKQSPPPISTRAVDPDRDTFALKLDGKTAITVRRFPSGDIRIDGKLDEAMWRQVPAITGFKVIEPDTLLDPPFHTEARVFYTEEGLYVGTYNKQPPDTLIPRLTSRDVYINRDGVSLTLDTSGEGKYGLWFGVNLGGSLVDGTVLPERSYSRDWDGPWNGASFITEDGYTTEMFLPWSMMSMPDSGDAREMGIYLSRKVAYIDERWAYPPLPSTGARLMSALQPIQMKDVQPRQQVSIFPFTAASYDNLEKLQDRNNYRVGADFFWRPSTNLQLTATLFPDFGATESDDVVVNLTATETFFPEKRLFFLEGSEIFVTTPRSNPFNQGISNSSSGPRRAKTSFNPEPTTVVNTRRIGGAPIEPDIPAGVDVPDVELSKPTELLGAIKLTGQTGGLRYGILGALEDNPTLAGTDATGAVVPVEQTGRDFGILRFLYENTDEARKAIGWLSTAVVHDSKDAYVHGIDLHYQNANRKWNIDSQLMYSDVSDVSKNGYGMFFDASLIPRRGVAHRWSFDYLDENLNVDDFGFIRRNNAIGTRYSYNTLTNVSFARTFSNSLLLSQEYNTDGQVVRSGIFWRTTSNFNNNSAINTRLSYFPKRWDDLNSRGNGDFKIQDRWSGTVSYGSDSAKALSFSIGGGWLEEDIDGITWDGQLGLTFKPSDRFSVELDATYKDREAWLLWQGGRNFTTFASENWQPQIAMDVFFNAKHQLRLTMQWVGIKAEEKERFVVPAGDGALVPVARGPMEPIDDFTISRITAQIRYRWEIAPLSDLFLVYTRGSNLPNRVNDDFGDLFNDAFDDPIIDIFVMKLRYRFGN